MITVLPHMSATLCELPAEVFRDFLLPELDVREVGSLTSVCRDLRDLCNENEIWKILYSRTTKRVVTDESLHAPKTGRCFGCLDTSDPVLCITRDLPLNSQPRSWGANCRYILGCWPKDLAPFPSWNTWWEINGGAPETVYHARWHNYADVHGQPRPEEYLEALREHWRAYNASKGLSTVNLCQCLSHYKESTLGFTDVKMRRKCYKRIVVQKLNTEKRKQLKSMEKKKAKKVHRVDEVRKYLEKLEAELRELEITEERLSNATTHLQEATDAL